MAVIGLSLLLVECVIPENIHTPPTEGIGNSGEEGESEKEQDHRICMKENWKFLGGRGSFYKFPLRWGCGYFLKLNN